MKSFTLSQALRLLSWRTGNSVDALGDIAAITQQYDMLLRLISHNHMNLSAHTC